MPPTLPREEMKKLTHKYTKDIKESSIVIEDEMEGCPPRLIVCMGNVNLDNNTVLDCLQRSFEGFSAASVYPACIVLMGSFISYIYDSNNINILNYYRKGFERLCDILNNYPQLLTHTKIIIIPSSNDPGGTRFILPRMPLCSYLTCDIQRKFVGRVELVGNPCRISYSNKQILLFCHNILSTMTSHSVRLPLSLTDISSKAWHDHQHDVRIDFRNSLAEEVCESVMRQAHLAPFSCLSPVSPCPPHSGVPLTAAGGWGACATHTSQTDIINNENKDININMSKYERIKLGEGSNSQCWWPLEHRLWMLPPPDVLILGDTSFPATSDDNRGGGWHMKTIDDAGDCLVGNVGSFPHSNYSFYTYDPETHTLEPSIIPHNLSL
eukprot:GHVR01013322.1.p1 GENE.GHVR01013322.1~~GHVR01013322.1.p1  ORF type:complete len:381 (+),score=102.63 GHVR01013322.1:80-1222(+)